MAKRKKTRPYNDIIDDLYLAVQQYVESNGGNVVVIGGVQVQQWPFDLEHNFTIGIRCTGKKPKLDKQ